MVSTDPIADMLTRIRNAIAVGKPTVSMPHSRVKEGVASLLAETGFIEAATAEEVAGFKRLNITINQPGQNARINHIQRMSSPGRRLYSAVDKIPRSKNGRGIVLVSTSKGLMTDTKARQERVGGELICEVY
jgi:small subunit ribosomal protein S8